MLGLALDLDHRGHRQPGRIDAVDAGGDQQVAVLDSALPAVKRSSSMPEGPPPKATARRPLRTIWTGIAWSWSVISVTSETSGWTRVTWPSTPASSITGLPGFTPCALAAVDEDLARIRVAAGVQHLRRRALHLELLAATRAGAQLGVLGLQPLDALARLRLREVLRARVAFSSNSCAWVEK